MEDFFQILIFIVFIVSSIISSRNKKKKKRQQQQQKTNTPTSVPTTIKNRQPTKEKTPQEILEELFGIKTNPPLPPPVYKEEVKVEDSVYETWNAEDDFTQTKHNDDYSYKEKDKRRKALIEQSKAAYTTYKKHSTSSVKKKSRTQTKLQKIFSNPSNLKEYIVINEILAKPKALRR